MMNVVPSKPVLTKRYPETLNKYELIYLYDTVRTSEHDRSVDFCHILKGHRRRQYGKQHGKNNVL